MHFSGVADQVRSAATEILMISHDPLERVHVILVEPGESLNVGSVARAMMNLGFHHLHLVAPRNYDRDRASRTAVWAFPLLDSLTIHETFEEAIADCEEVVGLALREGENPTHFVTLPAWIDAIPDRTPRKTALVFGREDNGLRQEHLDHCRWVIRIPSSDECPTFNLAQSALIVLYELSKLTPIMPLPEPVIAETELPTMNDFFQLDRLLDAVMDESGFAHPDNPGPGPGLIKNVFRRVPLNRREVGILTALVGRINKTLVRQRPQE